MPLTTSQTFGYSPVPILVFSSRWFDLAIENEGVIGIGIAAFEQAGRLFRCP